MRVPSLQPVSSSHFCVSGDVTIHPTATIAAGVLLQADPGSQVIVGAGVCLGMGTVLHAHEGVLEIEAEVTVGTGVLIVGNGKIGASACIGSASTLWNHSVERGTVVPPLSLLGTGDRQAPETASSPAPTPGSASIPSAAPTPSPATPNPAATSSLTPPSSPAPAPTSPAPQETLNGLAASELTAKQPTAEIQLSFSTPVYGQASLNRLLSTLLPHRHLFTPSEENNSNGESG